MPIKVIMENFDIKKYLEMALRRKYWIVIPFMLVLLGGFAYLLITPRIYEAKTLILVQEQKVPEDYVRSIVSTGAEERLRTITQQVTSRTNCEKIITDHQLYDDEKKMLVEEKVALLIKNINIDVAARSGSGGGNAFSISFQGKDPRKVMQVTNALASNFITENLKLRESQAIGTLDFLDDDLESKRKQLQEKEELVREYKEKYRGGLPEERDTNLRMLERLQLQLDQLNSNLRAAENRKLILQQGAVTAEPGEASRDSYLLTPQQNAANELGRLENELKSLKIKYTDNHPDIIDLKKRIETLEAQMASFSTGDTVPEPGSESVTGNQAFNVQLNDVQIEINGLRGEIQKVTNKINYYETKIEETPKRELELVSLNRDYENLRNSYQSMLDRKYEAEISVNLERKQKGEQFRVIDPAQVPLKPVKPNVQKLLILIIGLGLGIGCGVAYLVEMLDSSYRSPDDAEKELGFPVLVCLPYLFTEQELKARRKRRIIIASSMIAGYCAAIIAVVLAVKGFNETVDFVRELFTKAGVA
jgi:polysaccharide chain length determinant protein (PEP-CTERM system associated)